MGTEFERVVSLETVIEEFYERDIWDEIGMFADCQITSHLLTKAQDEEYPTVRIKCTVIAPTPLHVKMLKSMKFHERMLEERKRG